MSAEKRAGAFLLGVLVTIILLIIICCWCSQKKDNTFTYTEESMNGGRVEGCCGCKR